MRKVWLQTLQRKENREGKARANTFGIMPLTGRVLGQYHWILFSRKVSSMLRPS